MKTAQEISIAINNEIDRILPLVSTSDTFYGPYKAGLQFALNHALALPKPLIGWKCMVCGKDEFYDKSLPTCIAQHKCIRGNAYHRRGIKWLPIYEK